MIKLVKTVSDIPMKPHYVIISDNSLTIAGVERYSSYQTFYHYVTEDYNEWIKTIESIFKKDPTKDNIRFYECTYFPKVTVTVKVE